MDRREFFLNTAKASGVVLPWWGLVPLAQAQSYAGTILIDIHLDGGIDQSSWTDPIGNDPTANNYAAAGTPIVGPGIPGCNIQMAPMGNNATFLAANFQDMLVVNGCNTQTNSHGDGDVATATGRLEMGFAPICELHAAKHGVGLPMQWIAQGGSFQASAGLAAATPVPSADQLRSTVLPNAINATTDFWKQGDLDKVLTARAARLEALKASGVQLPREKLITDQFIAGKEARARLAAVAANIPIQFNAQFPAAQVGLIAGQSGITSAIHLRTGGFDGHNQLVNSYNGANGSLARATNLVQFIRDEAATRGLTNRLLILVRSEFGRTFLNGGNGKDHWPPGGTMVVIFPPGSGLGNRVVSATDERHRSVRINPTTGALDPNGIVVNPRHVHQAIHERLGISPVNPALALGVPAAEKIALFNPSMRTGYPLRTV